MFFYAGGTPAILSICTRSLFQGKDNRADQTMPEKSRKTHCVWREFFLVFPLVKKKTGQRPALQIDVFGDVL